MNTLDVREKLFVNEYIINKGNAKQAAIKAGYSKKTALHAYQWLTGELNQTKPVRRHLPYKPYLKAAIDAKLAEIESEKTADAKEVIEFLTSVMRRSQPDENAFMTTQEETTNIKSEHGAPGKKHIKKEVPQIVETKTAVKDATKAAELLGKMHGLFTDRVDVSGDMDINISIDYGDDSEQGGDSK